MVLKLLGRTIQDNRLCLMVVLTIVFAANTLILHILVSHGPATGCASCRYTTYKTMGEMFRPMLFIAITADHVPQEVLELGSPPPIRGPA